MVSKFVQEQKRYTRENLKEIFSSQELHCTDADITRIIKKLKAYGILKTVRPSDDQMDMTELAEEDVEVVDEDDPHKKRLYVFAFVGIIIIEGRILKCYPKYLFSNDEPIDELRQIIKVLQKYNSKNQIINMHNDGGKETTFNRLAILVFLLNDYFENGIYTNTEDIIETNGMGEIHWDRTINETYPIIKNECPYYVELQTKRRVNDEEDFIKRVHESVLTNCSNELKDVDLLDLLDLEDVFLTEELLSDMGDDDYIISRLEKEMNVQFNTQKQIVLKTLIAIIKNKSTIDDIDSFSLYGTNSFNLIWEEVCAEVFDNKLKTKLGQLKMATPLAAEFKEQKDETLFSIIEKPKWKPMNIEQEIDANDTLTPDLISIPQKNGADQFIIFDAKYYNLQLDITKPLRGNPGVGDVTKQYLYQLAYKKFIRAHNITVVKNCFLMPTEGSEIVKMGVARMPMLEALGLENIQIRLMPARTMYDFYLSRKKIDIDLLAL